MVLAVAHKLRHLVLDVEADSGLEEAPHSKEVVVVGDTDGHDVEQAEQEIRLKEILAPDAGDILPL